MGLSLALPFLRSMIQQQIHAAPAPDDGGDVVDMTDTANTPSKLPNKAAMPSFLASLAKGPMGPPVPPPDETDADVPAPPLNLGQGEVLPPKPADPEGDLTQSLMPQGAPQADKGSLLRQPGETKGHALLRILTAGARGGLNGLEQNAETYAATGRNAGFGGGVAGATMIPLQQAALRGQVANVQSEADLRKAQIQQMGQSVMVMTPNGPMYVPYPLAKGALGASIGGQYKEGAATIGAKGKTDAATIGADARVKAAQMGLGPVADVPQDLQDQFGLPAKLPLKMLNTAESAANRPLTTMAGENDTFVVNKQTGDKKALGVGSPRIAAALARPTQIADPDNPGETKFVSGGKAIATGAAGPQSASVQVPKAVAKKATSGNWADQKIAFNTAIQHAELLRDAAKALNNGDVRALASLSNRAKTQFGDPDLTNFQAIANAYNHEITSVISKGHITDNEVKSGDRTLPADANYETIDKVLKSYQSLAQSKMTQLQKQIDEGMKGNTGGGGGAKEIHYKIVNGQLVPQ